MTEYNALPSNKAARRERRYAIGHKIEAWVPVFNALKQSSAVLGSEMPMAAEAQKIKTLIEERLKGAAEIIAKHDVHEDGKKPCLMRLKEVGL
jgi:hypothetical protein